MKSAALKVRVNVILIDGKILKFLHLCFINVRLEIEFKWRGLGLMSDLFV